MAAKLFCIVSLTLIIPCIYTRIYKGFSNKVIFWGIFWGIMSATPLLIVYFLQTKLQISFFVTNSIFIGIISGLCEEALKIGASLITPILKSHKSNVIWIALGFGIIENYLYFVHIMPSTTGWLLFTVFLLGRSILTVPSHISYSGLFFLTENKLLGYIEAVICHAFSNICITTGYLFLILPVIIGITTKIRKKIAIDHA